jgi:hypothetical protein
MIVTSHPKNIQAGLRARFCWKTVQLVMQTLFELKRHNGEVNRIVSLFEKDDTRSRKDREAVYGRPLFGQLRFTAHKIPRGY